MYLTRLEVEGLRGADKQIVEPVAGARVVPLGGLAVADALDLFAAGLDPRRMLATAARLGWTTAETKLVGDPAPGGPADAELQGLHAASVEVTFAAGSRSAIVDATLALDPPLFGRLREHAVRDPRMVTALGSDPQVRIKVGWLATRDHSGVHPTVLGIRIGDVPFETVGKDRPQWVPELIAELGGRFHRVELASADGRGDDVAERLLNAQLSPDPAVRAGVDRARRAVTEPPFGLPLPSWVRSPGRLELVFGDELIRARQLGRAAMDAVCLAEAAFVTRPDVLVVGERLPADVLAWIGGLPEGESAPVEQVWVN